MWLYVRAPGISLDDFTDDYFTEIKAMEENVFSERYSMKKDW